MENQVGKIYNVSINIKDVLIVILILCLGWFIYLYVSTDSNKLLEDIKSKDEQIAKLQTQRDSLKNARIIIDKDIQKIKDEYTKDSLEAELTKKETEALYKQIDKLRGDVKFWEVIFKEQKKRIEDLEKNPIMVPKSEILQKLSQKIK
jgi:cell division protein FtsB